MGFVSESSPLRFLGVRFMGKALLAQMYRICSTYRKPEGQGQSHEKISVKPYPFSFCHPERSPTDPAKRERRAESKDPENAYENDAVWSFLNEMHRERVLSSIVT